MVGIYKITNLVDNRFYIGKSTNIEYRFEEHKNMRKRRTNTNLKNAIKTYGIENFKFEILEQCSEEILSEREKFWINYYTSIDKNMLYNIAKGGCGGDTVSSMSKDDYNKYIKNKSKPRGDEFKKAQSIRLTGKNNPMFGKHTSEKQKATVSNRVTGTKWINNGIKQTFVKCDELNEYLNNGWKMGMLPKK